MSDRVVNEFPDDYLVLAARDGDKQAFATIVERYQTLVCSIAYSAIGDIAQSEDCAQETFLTAWKNLGTLREPAKLKAWLCGISRNLAKSARRGQMRQAEALSELPTASQPGLVERLMSEEEERLLWRALERMPENYREPLVLFYRNGESIKGVSEALAVSEDTIKQRLSRGRKMLQDEVVGYVESALRRSGPGKAFTALVVGALPALSVSASAATAGSLAAKGAVAKGMVGASWLGALIGPALGFFGAYLGARNSLSHTQTAPERRLVVKCIWVSAISSALFLVVLGIFILNGRTWARTHPMNYAIGLSAIVLAQLAGTVALTYWGNRNQQRIRRQQADESGRVEASGGYEYRSPLKFLGLPLVHIKSGAPLGCGGPAKGWIAVGDTAVGVLFACGGAAVGGIALGGLAIGGVSFGGAALGWLALGGWAMGFEAAGGGAMAWHAAFGGLAIAHDYAQGGLAIATHANGAVSAEYFDAHWLSSAARALSQPWVGPAFIVLPLLLYSLIQSRSNKNNTTR